MPEARINTEKYAELLDKLAKDEKIKQKFPSDLSLL